MRLNKRTGQRGPATHEGAPAYPQLNPEQKLRRSLMSCLLWEGEFYEDGTSIAMRIAEQAAVLDPARLAAIAVEAREEARLRHAPLLLLAVLTKTGAGKPGLVSGAIERVIARADELSEFLAIYWAGGKRPLSAQAKKGLARAFAKFDAYELAKYDRKAPVKLRDVMFLVHPKPTAEQEQMWKQLADRELASPDTWEVALSGGAGKKATFERLLRERKLGYLALLRNLRNMVEADVEEELIRSALLARRGADRVLPFRYVAAARACPALEPEIDQALRATIGEQEKLAGRTIVLVDVSGSMEAPLSRRSDLTRMDAAAALAAIVNAGKLRVFTFSNDVKEVAARRGMGGVDAIVSSQPHAGTNLGIAVSEMNKLPHDRLIVITDEQSHDRVPEPVARFAYAINVASAKHGVGYGRWVHVDGFSEQVIRFIHAYEAGLDGRQAGHA
jgi:60 kDa SS-A/Ro ribonucleoprotein